MKKISVIIPVYNAMTSGGGYINRCVASVINQKNFPVEDIEVILINDGSKDSSLEVLKQIEKENPTLVRLIDQDNMGVAKTRNKGIKLARGEYVTFLDQDDWIDDDFFLILSAKAYETNADVIASGHRRPNKKGRVVKSVRTTNNFYGRYMLGTAWAKLHKTSFLRENKIEFFATGYGEDIPFSMKEDVTAKNYVMVSYIGYNWYVNETSVSNTSQKQLTSKTISDMKGLIEEISSFEMPFELKRDYAYFLLRQTIYCLMFSGRVAARSSFLLAKKTLFDVLYRKSDLFLEKNIHKLMIPPKGESFVVSLAVVVFIIFEKCRAMPVFAFLWCKNPEKYYDKK